MVLCALPARAQDELLGTLMGSKPKPFVEPEGYYAAVLPSGFDCDVRTRHVECKGNRGFHALLTIDVVDVPASATTELVFMNQFDRFKEKPHFKLIKKDRTKIAGTPAMTAAFSYDYLNNVELPLGVQALYLVKNGKEYVIHFEAALSVFGAYASDLANLYSTFKPARLDAGGHPILDDVKPKGEPLSDSERALRSAY